jgi:hypothetical protein
VSPTEVTGWTEPLPTMIDEGMSKFGGRDINRVWCGMVGGARVYDPICDGGLVQRHGAERVGEGLLVPAPSPWVSHRTGRQLARLLHVPKVDRQWSQGWHRGRPDLLRLIAKGGCPCHHGLRLTRHLLPETTETWPDLNRDDPGVEGGPRCAGTLILGIAVAGAAC